MDNELENRLSYTRIEYNQLWTFYQQLREENEQLEGENGRLLIEIDWLKRLLDAFKETDKENEQLKKAIENFGNNPAGFDWGFLDRIDDLETENERLVEFAREIIMDYCWNLYDADGGSIQDLAEKLNLIKPHIATTEDVDDFSDFDIGDNIYKFAPILHKP